MAGADVGDMFRKLREDASIRIRKEKRSDRMAQRRKVSIVWMTQS